jgi:N-methylhydantoinase A
VARSEAARTLLSGPAAGVVGASYVARASEFDQAISFDMGGTSTDVAMIDGGIRLTGDGRIGPWPVPVSMVDMHTIGAGGGSIARLDAGGALQVGPQSAGADPGPACYGRGGREPTVTDANLLLGRIPPEGFAGGGMRLNVEAARRVFEPLAVAMGTDLATAARGVLEVVEAAMAAALRVISVERGIDPRDFTLMSFGGAGGLHVCALAERLGMDEALVPPHAGVLSALGMLVTAPGRQFSRSLVQVTGDLDPDALADGFSALEAEARAALEAEGVPSGELCVDRRLDLRYRGQSATLALAWEAGMDLTRAFHDAHEASYGHALDQPVELVNLRLAARGPEPAFGLSAGPVEAGSGVQELAAPLGSHTCQLRQRAGMGVNEAVLGPALITDPVATTWVAPGWIARLDARGSLILTRPTA